MKSYSTHQEAIIDLHERGYSNDFELMGNNLLWIQEKIYVRACDFAIIECHKFLPTGRRQKELIIFGVIAIRYNAKGILMSHYNSYTNKTPLVIENKLKALFPFVYEAAG